MTRTSVPASFSGGQRLPKRRLQAVLVEQWKHLWRREFVELRRGAGVFGAGWIDEIAQDGTLVWINRTNGLGRSLIHRSDGIEIWRVDSRVHSDRPGS
ncbi:hypothetical protein [Arthrobacter sp. ISL-72]|uniref:hypothetical protein n=1 Tax=Arthrobacter sp. ISL-72 TaxID=2819114 RepID=UPI001BE9497D|nr:hypothetical protein [Arthrobacter sp. ISL-72]MBT2597964.1 hypothetical protein [Arthrobacter sp. ISL-72]